MSNTVRRAEERDMPAIMELLKQVNRVLYDGRPDLFKLTTKMIYEQIITYARQCCCYNVTLNVWSCNPGAIKFYERLGLVPYKIGMETLL